MAAWVSEGLPFVNAGSTSFVMLDQHFAAKAHGASQDFRATTSGSGSASAIRISIGAPSGAACQMPRAACKPLTTALSTVAILTGLIVQSPAKNRLVTASG